MRIQRVDCNYNNNSPKFKGRIKILNSWSSRLSEPELNIPIPKEYDTDLYNLFAKMVGKVGDGPVCGLTYRDETYYKYLKKVNEILKKLVGDAGNNSDIAGKGNDFERLNEWANRDLGKIARRDKYPSPDLAGYSYNSDSYQVRVSYDEGFCIEHKFK